MSMAASLFSQMSWLFSKPSEPTYESLEQPQGGPDPGLFHKYPRSLALCFPSKPSLRQNFSTFHSTRSYKGPDRNEHSSSPSQKSLIQEVRESVYFTSIPDNFDLGNQVSYFKRCFPRLWKLDVLQLRVQNYGCQMASSHQGNVWAHEISFL